MPLAPGAMKGFDLGSLGSLGSLWSSPRRWKAVMLTVFGATLLIALYQLSDLQSASGYKNTVDHVAEDWGGIDDTGMIAAPDVNGTAGGADDSPPTADTPKNDDKPEPVAIPGGQKNDDKKPDDKVTDEKKPEAEGDKTAEKKPEENKSEEKTPTEDDDDDDEADANAATSRSSAAPTASKVENKKPTETGTTSKGPAHGGSGANAQAPIANPACEGFPNTDGIMLVMKTGASESFEKLPAHFLTHMQCLPDFLLFSDLDQKIGQYEIHNVLGEVKESVKKDKKEFNLYDSQYKCPVSQKDCKPEGKAWDLDKYKFLHMVEYAWKMRPNMEWYVFAEADTYIFWPNLVTWLREKADPTKHGYVGSVAMLKGKPFAHGGSGYVITGELIKKMVAIPNLADKYDEMATHECCGDYLMSLAVMEAGDKVKNSHPMFNGEKPNTLPYGHGHWCEPLFTMHHVNSEEVARVWNYEKSRKAKGILQIKEMYHAFFAPNLVEKRDDWDNLSDDVCYIGPDEDSQKQAGDHEKGRQKKENEKSPVERRAHYSAENCAQVCVSADLDIKADDVQYLHSDEERYKVIRSKWADRSKSDKQWNANRRCFQWRYHKNACCIAKSFKQGRQRREVDAKERWTSGWFVDGINKWIEAKGDTCNPEWKEPH